MGQRPLLSRANLGSRQLDEHLQQLATHARSLRPHCYAPYSDFPVTAVVQTADGRIFPGVNVENASYGLTQCAERSAVCAAVSAGAREIVTVLVYTPTPKPTAPCGACRQVIHEFSPQARIVAVCDSDETLQANIGELLPGPFELA